MFERCLHFIPASKPHLFERIPQLGADAIIFDLEDAVAGVAKREALEHLTQWLSTARLEPIVELYVRVNGYTHPVSAGERDLFNQFPSVGIVLPKVCSEVHLQCEVDYYGVSGRSVIALIENISGFSALGEITKSGLITGVGLGLEDFLSDSLFEADQLTLLINRVRTEVALHAMAAGILAIDSISLDLLGGEGLRQDIDDARSAGLSAKFSIHPKQIVPIQDGFSPRSELLEKACRLWTRLGAIGANSGYTVIDGEIYSPPKNKKYLNIKKFSDRYEFYK